MNTNQNLSIAALSRDRLHHNNVILLKDNLYKKYDIAGTLTKLSNPSRISNPIENILSRHKFFQEKRANTIYPLHANFINIDLSPLQ